MFLEEDRLLAILPELILRRIPYRLAIRPLDVPATRRIGFAVRSFDRAPLAVRRFLDYLPLPFRRNLTGKGSAYP